MVRDTVTEMRNRLNISGIVFGYSECEGLLRYSRDNLKEFTDCISMEAKRKLRGEDINSIVTCV